MGRTVYNLWKRIAACFMAGLLAILPLALTVGLAIWVTTLIKGYVGPQTVLGGMLSTLGLKVSQHEEAAYVIGWTIVLLAIFGLGVLVEMGAKRFFQRTVDGMLRRVPVVGNVYGSVKQLVEMFDSKESAKMKGMSVVWCYFGSREGPNVLALMPTPERFRIGDIDYHVVIIPTAPVPFGGALLFAPADQVVPAQMSVDGLMSIYVSMGITTGEHLGPQPTGK